MFNMIQIRRKELSCHSNLAFSITSSDTWSRSVKIHVLDSGLPLLALPHKVSEILPCNLTVFLDFDGALPFLAQLAYGIRQTIPQRFCWKSEDLARFRGDARSVSMGIVEFIKRVRDTTRQGPWKNGWN